MTLPPHASTILFFTLTTIQRRRRPSGSSFAGLDYSIGKIVVYVAPKPPRSIFRSIADRLGHKILYVPLGQLSPAKLADRSGPDVLDSHSRRLERKTTSGNCVDQSIHRG